MTEEPPRPPRVLICTPAGDTMFSLTALHWAALFATTREYGIEAEPSMNMGSILPNNRSNLAQLAISSQPNGWTADAMFMIDSDMTFPPLSLVGLWQHGDDKDIIGATYQQRREGGETHGFELDGSRIDVSHGGPPREVATLPTGFMLVRRRVLEALKREGDLPFFRFPFERGNNHSSGEDYDLCARARALGFRVWLDPELSLALGHIGITIYRIPRAAG